MGATLIYSQRFFKARRFLPTSGHAVSALFSTTMRKVQSHFLIGLRIEYLKSANAHCRI